MSPDISGKDERDVRLGSKAECLKEHLMLGALVVSRLDVNSLARTLHP